MTSRRSSCCKLQRERVPSTLRCLLHQIIHPPLYIVSPWLNGTAFAAIVTFNGGLFSESTDRSRDITDRRGCGAGPSDNARRRSSGCMQTEWKPKEEPHRQTKLNVNGAAPDCCVGKPPCTQGTIASNRADESLCAVSRECSQSKRLECNFGSILTTPQV
jgi:hypothetical protein